MSEVYTAADFEHGLRCAACGVEFVEGQPISERLDAMTEFDGESAAMVTLICGECAVTGRDYS